VARKDSAHFERYGRSYQLRIRTPEDLERLLTLDESLWAATSAPVRSLTGNADFLAFVDSDANGRIRTDEMRAAVRWLFERLADRSRLALETDEVPLAALDAARAPGAALLDTARFVLRTLDAPDSPTIDMARLRAYHADLRDTSINGDGVVTADAAADADARRLIADVMTCIGGVEDHIGRSGITVEALDTFLAQVRAYVAWSRQGTVPEGRESTDVMPLGAETPQACAALQAVAPKVEQFYALCRALWLSPSPEPLATEAGPVEPDEALAAAPLARPTPDALLPLEGDAVNPHFRPALAEFRRRAVEPFLGPQQTLSEEQWRRVRARFAAHEEWLAARPGPDVEKLGVEALERHLDATSAAAVRRLLTRDNEVARRRGELRDLEKLLLYHKHLLRLANNLASFPDLYDPTRRAMFEMGRLVMDGRWFNFAVLVHDLKEHADLARRSAIYVMYVELEQAGERADICVAVPATSGTIGGLCAGKRGVFFDVAGQRYDARVIRIIENPISFREALMAPFTSLGRFIAGKIEAISGVAQKGLQTKLGTQTQAIGAGLKQAVAAPPAPAGATPPSAQPPSAPTAPAAAGPASSRRDLLIGASLSLAALSSAFAFVTNQLSDLTAQQLGLAAVALLLLVLMPTGLVAAIKLARRDLSGLLEACGWALNARMRLTWRQRRQFTCREPYPQDATGTPARRYIRLLLVLIVLASAAFALVQWWQLHR